MEDNKVLFIDDELNILASLRRGLMDEGYTCLFVDNGSEALEMMVKHEISVVVTDMKMPKMNGLQLLKECKQKYPDTVRIVMSGYTHLPQVLAAINQGDIFKFIPKPWNLEEEFKPAIREGLEYYQLKKKNAQLSVELSKKNELYKNILGATQTRFATFQSELDKIKEIGIYVFESMAHQLNFSNESLHFFNLYKELYTRHLNILPTENGEFDLKKIMDDLKASFQKDNYIDKININISENTNEKCYGNHKLFSYILYASCKSLIKIGLNNVTLVQMNLSTIENKGKIEYTIMGQLMGYRDHFTASTDVSMMEKEINIIYAFLGEISKHINGRITLDRMDRYISLKFSGEFVDNRVKQR